MIENIRNCTEWASKFLYNKGLFLKMWGLNLHFHLYSTFITATLWHSSFQEDIQCHTLCLYTLKYIVSRMENGFSGTVFLEIALGFVYYPDTAKHIYRIHRQFMRLSFEYYHPIHEYKFCFREPYDQNPVLISTLSVIKCRRAPMDLVRVETKSQVCIFWVYLGILYVQEQKNYLC